MKNTREEEDLDYMSDALLDSLSSVPAPGLVTVRSIARRRAGEPVSKKQKLTKTERERQALDEGLKKQVAPENKGFSLLMKMGYKPGEGLGKNAEGRREPVSIEMPEGRSGLGLVSSRKEKIRAEEKRLREVRQVEQQQFRLAVAERYRLGRLRNQLSAARNMCFQLDTERSIDTPLRASFWPTFEEPTDVQSDGLSKDDDNDNTEDSRTKHVDISRTIVELDDPDDCVVSRAKTDEEEEAPEETLEKIVRYLRRRHSFCFWCSIQYESQEQLLSDCPGTTEADHD